MGPALSPGAVGQEMAACAVLGGVLGAARAVLPTRGRAAFLPDMLFVGVALMALQSYAVSQSQAGQLRGYMALAAFCAAGAVQAALRPLFAAAEAFAGKLLLGPVRLAASINSGVFTFRICIFICHISFCCRSFIYCRIIHYKTFHTHQCQ